MLEAHILLAYLLALQLATCNLKQFGRICPVFLQKWQTHKGLSCNLSLGRLGFLGLDSLRSTLIFLRGGVTFTSLTISLLEGSKKETKFVEWVSDIEMLSTKPRTNLFKGHFWTLNMWSSLELADLFVYSLTTDNSSSKFLILSSNKMFSVFTLLINSLMIGQECIDPLWWINWLISKVY